MAARTLNQKIRRRTLLVAGVGTAAVGVTQLEGWTTGNVSLTPGGGGTLGGRCVPRSTLTTYSRIGQSVFVYEPNGEVSSFSFDEAFHDQLSELSLIHI